MQLTKQVKLEKEIYYRCFCYAPSVLGVTVKTTPKTEGPRGIHY